MMAAHAKDRNLRNGSITTGGTANAQTFSSGVGYSGTVPTGLCVKLKAGFTNTGAMTLSMDAITAQAVVDMAGNPAAANAFIAGRYVDLLFDGTLWRLIGGTGISGGGGGSSGALTTTNVECGRLEYVGATQLKFAPFKGDMMKINGTLYNIPAAGIVGMGKSSVFVNGVAGQNLAPSLLYYIYAFNNAGVVTADYCTSATPHVTSTTAGNIGTEIKQGNDSRSLIGMAFTDSGGNFRNTPAERYVLSWFNRRSWAIQGASTNGASLTFNPGGPVEIHPNGRIGFITWNGDSVLVTMGGSVQLNAADLISYAHVGIDGSLLYPQASLFQSYFAGAYGAASGAWAQDLTENLHVVSPFGNVSGGVGNFYLYLSGIVQG
jgi:hypothetical protein